MGDGLNLALTLSFDGHRVRMAGTPERPEWIAKDVCHVLYLRNTADALRKAGVTESERGVAGIYTPGGPQDVTTVTESGLWKLVLASRKPSAQRFKQWLAAEVIPAIRKHGCYPPPAEAVAPAAVLNLRDVRQLAPVALHLAQLVQEMAPKAEGYDRLQGANGDLSLMDAGRILRRPPRKLIDQLEADGILFRGRGGKHEPRCDYRERGLFRVRVLEVDGDARIQTLVTPRGLQWLATRYPAEDRSGSLEIM